MMIPRVGMINNTGFGRACCRQKHPYRQLATEIVVVKQTKNGARRQANNVKTSVSGGNLRVGRGNCLLPGQLAVRLIRRGRHVWSSCGPWSLRSPSVWRGCAAAERAT